MGPVHPTVQAWVARKTSPEVWVHCAAFLQITPLSEGLAVELQVTKVGWVSTRANLYGTLSMRTFCAVLIVRFDGNKVHYYLRKWDKKLNTKYNALSECV